MNRNRRCQRTVYEEFLLDKGSEDFTREAASLPVIRCKGWNGCIDLTSVSLSTSLSISGIAVLVLSITSLLTRRCPRRLKVTFFSHASNSLSIETGSVNRWSKGVSHMVPEASTGAPTRRVNSVSLAFTYEYSRSLRDSLSRVCHLSQNRSQSTLERPPPDIRLRS